MEQIIPVALKSDPPSLDIDLSDPYNARRLPNKHVTKTRSKPLTEKPPHAIEPGAYALVATKPRLSAADLKRALSDGNLSLWFRE